MPGTECIKAGFTAPGKTGKSIFLAQRIHLLASPGENFMGIGLMAHIPYQAVIRRIETIMQGDGQFHYAQTRGQMTTGAGNCINQEFT